MCDDTDGGLDIDNPTLWDDAFIVSVFNVLMERCYNTAKEHGFWDPRWTCLDCGSTNVEEIEGVCSKSKYGKCMDCGCVTDGHRLFGVTKRYPAESIALMHSELSEALEAYRENEGKERYAEELADLLIRVFDFAFSENLDLGNAVLEKMEINKQRSHKHNKEF